VEFGGDSGKYAFPAGIVHGSDSFNIWQLVGLNMFLIYLECRPQGAPVKTIFTRVYTGTGSATGSSAAGGEIVFGYPVGIRSCSSHFVAMRRNTSIKFNKFNE